MRLAATSPHKSVHLEPLITELETQCVHNVETHGVQDIETQYVQDVTGQHGVFQ